MGTTFLPINSNWDKYIQKSDEIFNKLEKEVKSILMQKADEALKLLENERYFSYPFNHMLCQSIMIYFNQIISL